MKINTQRFAAGAALAMVASLGLAACGSDDNGGGSDSDATTVTFLPKNLGNPYFETSDAGGEKAVEEFGGTFDEVGPDTAGPDAQVTYIDTAAAQGVNALIVSANDPTALCDSLNAARDAGTKVSSPSTPTPTPSAATSSSTRPPPRASPRCRSR